MQEQPISYFVMETAVSKDIPTFSGGLGVLSGDITKGSADMGVPLVTVTLNHNNGYFKQVIKEGNQYEEPDAWEPSSKMKKLDKTVEIKIGDTKPKVFAWQYDLKGIDGYKVPVLFLDTNSEDNEPRVRCICDNLYWDGKKHNNSDADKWHRLQQEIVLGVGGVKLLEELGYTPKKYNINESHATPALLEVARKNNWDIEKTKKQSSFITHTPVPAGHERFPKHMVRCALEESFPADLIEKLGGDGNDINMSKLAKNLSGSVFAVSKKNAEVARAMFPDTEIKYVTNAVHLPTWVSESYKELFDRHFPGWIKNPSELANALCLPDEEVWHAHEENKGIFVDYVEDKAGVSLDKNKLTLGWARRSTEYKRPELIFTDVNRLIEVCGDKKVQKVVGGKAHPRDGYGTDSIKRIIEIGKKIDDKIPFAFLPNYGTDFSRTMISGSDVWLNTPRPPHEASGTSGMKACINGVLNLSSKDGWWLEELPEREEKIGWSFGLSHEEINKIRNDNSNKSEGEVNRIIDSIDADSLYRKLGEKVIPKYYGDRKGWIEMQKHAISRGSHYNTVRLIEEYKKGPWN